MPAKIKEILGQRQIKYLLLIATIIGFAVCMTIMQARIIDTIIDVVETNMLYRKLESADKWKDYLFGAGYSFTVFFVLVWYFFIKRKFIVSSFFLLAAFGIYLYTYKLFTLDYGWSDLLRFPMIALSAAIAAHVVVNRQYFYPLANRLKIINRRLIENSFLNSSSFVFICGGLLGALFFLYIFGTAILDFTYTDWLMAGGDLSQHYLGWKLFRNSSWYFPLGLMDNIVYPFKISIIYSDSIPLFAVIFKLLSPALPENFQYLGLFGIMCYILQGGISALIIRKIGGNTGQSIIGSLFFTLSTVMLWRIYAHTSLSAHFIILLCILACLQKNNLSPKKGIFTWSALLALSASVHLYFVPMVMLFMFFRLLQEYTLSKNLKNQCVIFGVSCLVLTGTMFCLGAFYFVKDTSTGGLGQASANLNAFVNPQGMSRFIKDMPLATGAQYEGNAYLGLGIILFAAALIFQLYQKNRSDFKTINKQTVFPVVGIVLSFLLFSLSPTITFFQYKLFTYPVIQPFERLWSIFRSTGRMTWPVIYIVMAACIYWAVNRLSVKKSILLLSVFLLIQWVDLKPAFVSKGNDHKTKVSWQSELSSPVWENLANEYKHIFFANDYTKEYSFEDLAGNHKMTLNDTYLARKNSKMINDNKQKEMASLANGESRNDTVYVFLDAEQALAFKGKSLFIYRIDDVIIGIDSKKTYLGNYEL